MSEPVAVPVENGGQATEPTGSIPTPPDKTNVSSEVEPTPSLYEKPYVAKYYGIDGVWENISPDIQDAGETIMEYYKSKVGKEIADSKEAFQDFMKGLERTTDTKHAPTEAKLKIISEFVRYLTRIKLYK